MSNSKNENEIDNTVGNSEVSEILSREPIGIANAGNTCYFNSALQLLYNTHELTYIMNSTDMIEHSETDLEDNSERKNGKKILENLKYLQSRMQGSTSDEILDYNNVKEIIGTILENINTYSSRTGDNKFLIGAEHDVGELIQELINAIHSAISRPMHVNLPDLTGMISECNNEIRNIYRDNYSEIIETFYTIEVSTIQILNASDNAIPSTTLKEFFILELPIPIVKKDGETTLYDMLDIFTSETELDVGTSSEEKNKTKTVKFGKLPNILIIRFNRVRYTQENNLNNQNAYTKDITVVKFPFTDLDLSRYAIENDTTRNIEYKYDLYGVSSHIGANVSNAHYTCWVKIQKKWFYINDNSVTEPNNFAEIIMKDACLLFYRRKFT